MNSWNKTVKIYPIWLSVHLPSLQWESYWRWVSAVGVWLQWRPSWNSKIPCFLCQKQKQKKNSTWERTQNQGSQLVCVIYCGGPDRVRFWSGPPGLMDCLISLMTRFTHCVLAWHQSARTGPGPRPTAEAPNLSRLPKHGIDGTILLFNLSP